MFYIMRLVSGEVTGFHKGLLKSDGEVVKFDSRESAQTHADELNKLTYKMNRTTGTVFRYWVEGEWDKHEELMRERVMKDRTRFYYRAALAQEIETGEKEENFLMAKQWHALVLSEHGGICPSCGKDLSKPLRLNLYPHFNAVCRRQVTSDDHPTFRERSRRLLRMNFRKLQPIKKSQPIRLVIVDDHPIFRDGLRRWLEAKMNLKVVGEASNTAEAVKLVRELKADILTTDLARPKDSGFETLRELNTNATPVRAIVLSAAIEKSRIVEALQLGARGVVLKDSATQVLIEAIRKVMAGEYWVHREPVSNLEQYLRTLMQSTHYEARQKKFGLTPRELEIVSAVVSGFSNKEIAEYFKIGEDTVRRHLSNISDKMGVSTRLELALFAVNQGLPLKTIE